MGGFSGSGLRIPPMAVSCVNGSGSLAQTFDSLTPQRMRERGSLKWSQYPGDVIGAWVAEMDLGTAPAVEAAIHQAMHDGLLGYMPPSVSQAAREEMARYQREAFGWQVEAEQVSLLYRRHGEVPASSVFSLCNKTDIYSKPCCKCHCTRSAR